MTTHDVVWMVTDSLQVPRTEYGPYNTRLAAEVAAVRLHARYLLRYEQAIGSDGTLLAERVFAIKMPATTSGEVATGIYTRCATCGEAASHQEFWQAEVWADIHEFEHSKHLVRLFVRTKTADFKEIPDWRRDLCCGERVE